MNRTIGRITIQTPPEVKSINALEQIIELFEKQIGIIEPDNLE